MALKIGSVKGYYFLDAWIMAKIMQLSTFHFCKRFLNKEYDPCGRMFDQMTQAARSCSANIAEGLSRHQTSRETEMKLLDVARASISELLDDYLFWSMTEKIELWDKGSEQHLWVANLKLTKPTYNDDWTREAQQHIRREYGRFAPALENENITVVINSNIILCNRLLIMVEKMIHSRLEEFKQQGGFTENLSQVRLQSKIKHDNSPNCPSCGARMVKRIIQKGTQHGNQFWGCSNFPRCNGTLPLSAK